MSKITDWLLDHPEAQLDIESGCAKDMESYENLNNTCNTYTYMVK